MEKEIIFVSGIHGVGKTTICTELSNLLGIKHYSASSLIKKNKNKDVSKTKQVTNVSKNQNDLIQAISLFVPEKSIILDGHFTLLDQSNNTIDIPLCTFEQLDPHKIIIITESISLICKRLHERDHVEHDTQTISKLQQCELERAQLVAKYLTVSLLHVTSIGTTQQIYKFIKGI